MASVQRLRHQAQAAGTLTTTQQQRVAEENGTIAIEPGKPEYRLRAGLQSDGRLWRLAKSGVSACVYSSAGRLFAGQRGRWRICLWHRRGDRRLAVGMGASGVASRPRPRRCGSLQPYQREPGCDPVRGLASTALCRGGPTFPTADGAGRTATASGAPGGVHLRLAECHDAWSSGAPLDGARVPAAARSVDPTETAGRAPAGRYRAACQPPARRLPAAIWIDPRGGAFGTARVMRRMECAAWETSAGCLTSSTSTCWRR